MHCEIVAPGLFAQANTERFASLELLLARGRCRTGPAQQLEAWLQESFELEALAAGALTMLGSGRNPGDAHWTRADPVHLRVMREHVILVPGEALQISGEEADALCEALNRHFPGANFTPCDAQRWCTQLADIPVEDGPASYAAGREVQPRGAAARLLNEVQMLLHTHPVNEAREARGEPTVNSVWFWGSGIAPRTARSHWQSVAAQDPLVLGAARLAGARHRPLPPSATDWLERLPEDGRHLAVLDAPVAELESQWFAPLLAALRAGRVGMATLHVPDAAEALSFETIRADLRRFWRLAKPIEHYA